MAEAPRLTAFVPDQIWLCDYPIRYAEAHFNARMTVLRLTNGQLILHSPCEITQALAQEITALGPVGWIVAPGTFHHLHVAQAQSVFAQANVLICPGVEKKQPNLHYDAMLSDTPPPEWGGEIALAYVPGNRIMSEVLFLHRASHTLVVTDLIELIGDGTKGVDWVLKLWWKWLTFMWNKPRPATEYTLGWRDKRAAAKVLTRVLDWEFDKIVLAHGDLVAENAKAVAREAWAGVLKKGG